MQTTQSYCDVCASETTHDQQAQTVLSLLPNLAPHLCGPCVGSMLLALHARTVPNTAVAKFWETSQELMRSLGPKS